MIQVRKIEVIGDYQLRVWFSDGSVGDWDYSAILERSGPVALPLHDPAYFARVFIEAGAPTWPNGYDACPDSLHQTLEARGALRNAMAAE